MDSRELFQNKVELEYKVFCRKLLEEDKETILENACRAECMKDIHDAVIEISAKWTEESLEILLIFPGILEYIYSRWMKTEDSFSAELGRCIRKAAGKLVKAYQESGKEEAA